MLAIFKSTIFWTYSLFANTIFKADAVGEPAIAMGNGNSTITVVNTVSGKILFELDGKYL